MIEDILPTGGKLAIFAPPKTGKSWVALQMIMDVANGKSETLSFPIRTTGPTLYLQLDTPRSLWVEEYLLKLKHAGEKMNNIYFADVEEIPSYPFDIRAEQSKQWLRDAVASINPAVVVLDTWRESFRGDENDGNTAQDVLSSLVSATGKAAVIIVTHVSKAPAVPDAPTRSLVDQLRGSTYLAGAVDGLMLVGGENLAYKSRTAQETIVKLARNDHMWVTPSIDVAAYLRNVMENSKLTSLGQRIRELSRLTSRPQGWAKKVMMEHLSLQP